MDCPRCGGGLDRYELAGRVEASCGDCGYAGVPVDHESDRPTEETWADAVDRYEETFADAGDVNTGPAPPPVPQGEAGAPRPTTVRTAAPAAGTTGEDGPDGTSDPHTDEVADDGPTAAGSDGATDAEANATPEPGDDTETTDSDADDTRDGPETESGRQRGIDEYGEDGREAVARANGDGTGDDE